MANVETHTPGSFCWFELGTTDQNGAKEFYEPLFGWASEDTPMGPGSAYTIFKLAKRDVAAAYTLTPEMLTAGLPAHWMPYIAVEDADLAATRAQQLGGKVTVKPFDVMDHGRMAVIQDPTGALFSIWQKKSHGGAGIVATDGAFCWADLSTKDIENAVTFYSQMFGWQIAAAPNDSSNYLHIENQGHHIGGIPPAEAHNEQVPPHWMIYFQIPNCDEASAKAKQLGATVFMKPMTMPGVGRWSIVADPQGAVFALFQEKDKL